MDRAFLTATTLPLLCLAGAVAYKLRPVEWQKQHGKEVNAEHVTFFLSEVATRPFIGRADLDVHVHHSRRAQAQVFEDPDTGALFETDEGVTPEKDRRGELAFLAVSYTPWPVEAGAEGDRVRVPVGPVNACVPRTFVFPRYLAEDYHVKVPFTSGHPLDKPITFLALLPLLGMMHAWVRTRAMAPTFSLYSMKRHGHNC
jgi:hypothetical protein